MSEMRALRVGVDLDGVNYDFAGALRLWLHGQGRPLDTMPDPQQWDFFHDWGLTLQQFVAACDAAVNAGFMFRIGEPLPGAVAAVAAIKHAGHEVHIVTDRTFGAGTASEDNTRGWLADHRYDYDSLTFSPDKTVADTDVFVEDKLANYDVLDAAGQIAYLIDRPWNHVPGDTRRRIPDITAFASAILSGEAHRLLTASETTR